MAVFGDEGNLGSDSPVWEMTQGTRLNEALLLQASDTSDDVK